MTSAPLLLVLGTEFSGLSVLSSILDRLGVVGPSAEPLSEERHSKNFLEWTEVSNLQESFLIDLERWEPSWRGHESMPKQWLEEPNTRELHAHLRYLLEMEMASQRRVWAVKDSRICRLLPLWLVLAENLQLPLHVLLAVRDPAEVVSSWIRGDGESNGVNPGRIQRLWWRQNLEVVEACAGRCELSVVNFGSWFERPEAQLQSVLEVCPGLDPTSEQRRDALSFIRADARHEADPEIRQSLASGVRQLYRKLCRKPLPRRWPSSSTESLPRDLGGLPSASTLLAEPHTWQNHLVALRDHPAPRRRPALISPEETLLMSSCGATMWTWATHLWLQRVPLQGLGGRHLNKSSSGEHQCLLEAAFKTTSPPVRITLNFECPEPERIEEWLGHLRSQDLIWDPDPARVLLLRALGLPAWWLDSSHQANGWLDRPEASAQDAWLEQLGMPPPSADVLLVLGALGPGWDQALVAEGEFGQHPIEPLISYVPGWTQLLSDCALTGLAWAGWLVAANRSAARLIWAQATDLNLDPALAALDPARHPAFSVESPLLPEELRALHAGSALMATVEDRPTPTLDTLFDWSGTESMPCVAVVLSSFNYATRIQTALDSVLRQTATPLELIVVDDASTDDSAAVVQSWMDQQRKEQEQTPQPMFSRLLLLRHQVNSGLATARNTAFAAARADWCFVLDADNRLLPEAVKACLEVVERLHACPRLAVVHPLIAMEIEAGRADEQRSLLGGPSWQRGRFLEGNIVDAMALVRRSAWRAVGGYSHLEGGWEDYDFWCKFVAGGWQGVQCPQVLALYRSHTDAMTFRDTAHRQRALSRTLQQRHPWLRLPLSQ